MDENILGKGDWNHEEELRKEGRNRAMISIYENMYKQIYRLQPTQKMTEVQNKLDDLKWKALKDVIMITINFPTEFNLTYQIVNEILNVIKTRTWVSQIHSHGRENMTKELEDTHPHLHICCQISKLYSPAQMVQMIWRNKYIQKHIKGDNFIDIKKYPNSELSKIKQYCEKNLWKEV